MKNPIHYHQKVKNEQHVFIYCVAGRSSSTAFQRILNSSNTVWIWGERHHMLDETIALANNMITHRDSDVVKHSLKKMYECYDNNKHLSFYPNAIGNLGSTIDILNSSISNFLRPWASKIKRFGFKDIEIKDIHTLIYLKEIFANSFVIFGFRNPLKQWPSIYALKDWWSYQTLQAFLDEYFRISNIYLEFAEKYGIPAFIESDDLKHPDKVRRLIEYLNIPKIDETLINVIVDTAKGHEIPEIETAMILSSKAYENYLKMLELSIKFFTEANGLNQNL